MIGKAVILLILPFAADALRFSEAKKPSKVFASLLQAEEGIFKEEIPETLKVLQKALEQAELDVEMACSPQKRENTRKNIQAKNWDLLEKDVCMEGHGEELESLKNGLSDVADVGEWLDGDFQVPTELRAHETEQAMKSKGQICKKTSRADIHWYGPLGFHHAEHAAERTPRVELWSDEGAQVPLRKWRAQYWHVQEKLCGALREEGFRWKHWLYLLHP